MVTATRNGKHQTNLRGKGQKRSCVSAWIAPELQKRIEDEAAKRGVTVSAFANELLTRTVVTDAMKSAQRPLVPTGRSDERQARYLEAARQRRQQRAPSQPVGPGEGQETAVAAMPRASVHHHTIGDLYVRVRKMNEKAEWILKEIHRFYERHEDALMFYAVAQRNGGGAQFAAEMEMLQVALDCFMRTTHAVFEESDTMYESIVSIASAASLKLTGDGE